MTVGFRVRTGRDGTFEIVGGFPPTILSVDASIPNHGSHRPAPAVTQEWERTYAMWTHIGGLIACVLAVATAGIGFWGPPLFALVMWLGKRERSAFIDDHGRESLNFAISLVLYCAIAFVAGFATCSVGWFVLAPAIVVLTLVGFISGARHAARGEFYRYPMCLRFVG